MNVLNGAHRVSRPTNSQSDIYSNAAYALQKEGVHGSSPECRFVGVYKLATTTIFKGKGREGASTKIIP